MSLILLLITLISFNYISFSKCNSFKNQFELIVSKSVIISWDFQEGQYNNTNDLDNKANGSNTLNITTTNQNINKKIII